MTIQGATIKKERIKVMQPGDYELPQTSEIHESAGAGPLDGEIVHATVHLNVDRFGDPIKSASTASLCIKSNSLLSQDNSFKCSQCHSVCAIDLLAQETPVQAGMPVNMSSRRQGICTDCWGKGRVRRILAAILNIPIIIVRLILAPFLKPQPTLPTIPSAPAPPSASSTPSAAPRPKPPRGGASVISIMIAVGCIECTPAKAMIPVNGCEISRESEVTVNNYQANQYAAQIKAVQKLIEEAILLGLDNAGISSVGWRYIKNLQRGIESGNIPEYDLNALTSLVGRARNIIIPMEWRVAFAQNPPPDIISQGDIYPFTLLDGTPVGLNFSEMAESMRLTGRPGSTKSTGGGAVLDASIAAGKSVFIIDSKGDGQFDYLCRKYPGRVLKVRIGRPGLPFFNPWQWPRQNRDYALNIFSRRDSKIVLDAAMEQGLKQNALNGARELTHAQLKDIIRNCVTPSGFILIPKDFFRSMFSVFYDVECSPLRNQIACQRGYDLREIVKQGYSVIIDTSAIAGTLQEELLVVTLLTALRQEIINDPILRARTGTQVVFFIDECTNLSAASKVPGSLPSLVHLATLVRSSSICLFAVYHSISVVHPVLNAAGIWMVTQISDGNDIFTAKKTFALTDQQAKALTSLPKGVAMVRMGNRYTEPFLATYPRIPDAVKMSDAEIDVNNAPILATLPPIVPENYRKIPVPVIVTPPVASKPVPPAATAVPPPAAPVVAPAVTMVSIAPSALDNDYMAILKDIAAKPFLNVSGRAGQLALPSGKKLNYRDMKVALDELKGQGFVDEVAVQLSPHAGPPSLMHFLTATGHAAIGSVYKPSRSGYRHDFGQRLIRDILAAKSITANIEATLPGRNKVVDIGFNCPVTSLPIAIELPVSTFHSEPDQAERDLADGWARVIEVCFTKNDLENLTKAFSAKSPNPDSRIKLSLVSGLKAVTSLSEIYDSTDFIFKVKAVKTKNKKGSAI
ncbi:MAG: hypothetical protein WCI20_00380 [bacterium]